MEPIGYYELEMEINALNAIIKSSFSSIVADCGRSPRLSDLLID